MEIAIIDIETTGFNPKTDYILEVGIVLLDTNSGEIEPLMNVVTFENGITVEILENCWIINNSSLTVNQVKYGVNFKRISKTIQSIVNKYPVTAFNRKFDIGFLEARGIECNNLYPCPMMEATNVLQLEGKNGSWKYPKVQEAYDYFFPDSGYIEEHRGFDDALHEAQIVYELYKLTNR